jgi:hypothetical protein
MPDQRPPDVRTPGASTPNADSVPFGKREEERSLPWVAMAIGAAVLGLAIVAVILFSRGGDENRSGQTDPYAANLKFTELKLSASENFVGGNVTYLDGTLTNSGTKTVNGVTVELTFHNTLNEVVQKETMRVKGLTQAGPYPDIVDLRSAPIAPGKSRTMRLTLDHISADWNRVAPDIKVTSVSFQ